ncbi:MAG TPA: PD-(D/E)XK nuclease family protein [candidate division Zixibacteria bacterium]|nr:PD-(D/E)XK nuclease family protein [candidate division Zixibacteria bacterium]
MKAFLGPFHPELENALAEAIRSLKAADPMAPALVVVPSAALGRRVRVLLASERRLALLNVHLWTFHQLYVQLLRELPRSVEPDPADDLIFEEALGAWIRGAGAQAQSFLPVVEKAGGCAALWQTLRDLRDASVGPEVLAAAVEEGLFEPRDAPKLEALARLHAGFSEHCRERSLADYAAFVTAANERAATSRMLGGFARIFYYGFYDLTQVQLEAFRTVARAYPTVLFFPCVRRHPAWAFAERFYERHIQGLVTEETVLLPGGGALPLFETGGAAGPDPAATRPACAIWSCPAPRDECVAAAKEILRLRHDEDMAFSEIGVVARAAEPYARHLVEVFREHRIPVHSSFELPLVESPLVKSVVLLLRLAERDYPRNDFVDLVSSPYFDFRACVGPGPAPRPDLWDMLTRRLGITRGVEEWSRLKRFVDRGLEIEAGGDEDGGERTLRFAAEQVSVLWSLFSALERDLGGLPAAAPWNEHASAWRALLEKYFGIRDGDAAEEETAAQRASRAVLETLSALSTLDVLGSRPSRATFAALFERWLERKSLPVSDPHAGGVAVLDAMAARGSRFRALFVLGLNEGLFPRTIREDAFLRDRSRRVIETVLGCKIAEKLAGFEEEKLLLALLADAATERLYALYSRSDENGVALEPSWYVAELRRIFAAEPVAIPRSILAKRTLPAFRDEFLLPEELAIRLSLDSQSPAPLLSHFPAMEALCRRGAQALEVLENADGPLSGHDGMTGHLESPWRRLADGGVSPTALERYARCPFQFFALNVLGLEPQERPEEQSGVRPVEIGSLVHRILKDFFQQLMDRGYFARGSRGIDAETLLESVARSTFDAYEREAPTGYPLVWEILRDETLRWLKQTVAADLQDLAQSGRRPVALETELEGTVTGWPAPASTVRFRGRLDRIDFDPAERRLRVIDYKFKAGKKPSASDVDLMRSALRGEKLQPPIYVLLARDCGVPKTPRPSSVEAAFYYLAPRWSGGPLLRRVLPQDCWEGATGRGLRQTLSFLIEGVYRGLHFIRPGPACRYCEVANVCRKDHLPTVWRAASDARAAAHAELARQQVAGKSDE